MIMRDFITVLTSEFGNNEDLFIEEERIGTAVFHLCGFNTLVDTSKTKVYIRQIAETSSTIGNLLMNLSDKLDVKQDELIKAMLNGKLIILAENGKHNAIIEPIPNNLVRSIQEPRNSSPIQASNDAFVEDIKTNVGLVRKRLPSKQLCYCSSEVGDLQKRKISLLYIKGNAPQELINDVNQQLKQIHTDIESVDDLNRSFGRHWWCPTSHFFVTELPFQAIHFLKRNRIVIFLDNYPFGLVYPNLFWDMFATANDHDFPLVTALLLRFIRVIGAITTLVLPALYVAVVAVNPELLKIDLALFVAQSREGIPFTALLETFIMTVLVDLILEAIVRLPKSVGPSVTMVGGVILGTAVVDAKLVSNLLVIVITAIVISGSVIVGVQSSLYIRLLKYPILIMASIYGILGLLIGFIFISIYLISLTSSGIPYTAFAVGKEGDTR
jgi:hypothetical protein